MKQASLSLRQQILRWNAVLLFVIVSTAILPKSAQASHPVDNHCISPASGEDLNILFGTTKQIITPFCNQVDAGEQWTAAGPSWFINTDFDLVPEGFVPTGATPLEDFVAKFVAIKYVIDPGTLQERTFIYPTSNALWIGTNAAGFQSVWPGTLSTLPPLSIGEHFVAVYWVFNAMHCDGFGEEAELFCLGPGEVPYAGFRFEVTPGAAQSH